MIIDLFISIAYGFFGIFLQMFPFADSGRVALITSQLSGFRSMMASANWLFPVSTFFLLASAVFAIELSVLAFKVLRWIVHQVTFGFVKK